MTKLSRTERMVDAAIKSTEDYLAETSDNHGEAETLLRILKDTRQKLKEGLISSAAQEYVQSTGRSITFSEWSPRLGLALEVLNFRLLDLDGKLNNLALAHWEWPPDRMT